MSIKTFESLRTLNGVNIIIGIVLTLVAFCFFCCTPRKHHVSVLFVTNLLISNLLLSCSLIPFELMTEELGMGALLILPAIFFALMIGLFFRMCIAVERYMIIAHPTYIRGPWTSALACVAPWVLCILITFTFIYFYVALFIYLLLLSPIPLAVIFVVLTFVALPAATSVPIEEKRRTVGVLVLLLVDYILLIISALILFIYSLETVGHFFYLLTVFVDLALSVLMFKGPVDRFLARLCYCMTDNSVTTDNSISL